MIAQLVLSSLLGGLLLYAIKEAHKSPIVGTMAIAVAIAGLYVVWVPSHASILAEWVGIGRGADLILYVWAAGSLIVMLNLHLKLRSQLELITALARSVALRDARDARNVALAGERETAPDRQKDEQETARNWPSKAHSIPRARNASK